MSDLRTAPVGFEDLGRHLLAARTRHGLTQEELAARCGLDRTQIVRFERGERWPSLDQLTRLACALTVSLQWFKTGTNQPGTTPAELVLELAALGMVDLVVGRDGVPGAFRPPEQLIARVLSGDTPDARVIERLPAVLAWNEWDARVLEAYGLARDPRAAPRAAWLADVALTIHRSRAFPGGCPAELQLSALIRRVSRPAEPDSLGYTADDPKRLPPVSRRWNITYEASLSDFETRAEQLYEFRRWELSRKM